MTGCSGKMRQIFRPEEKCEDSRCFALIISTGTPSYLKFFKVHYKVQALLIFSLKSLLSYSKHD